MLKVVFVAILFGIVIIQIPDEKGQALIKFFDSLNEVIIKIVDFVMLIAPYGVFEIGRASCRERVWIWVGDGSLKRKRGIKEESARYVQAKKEDAGGKGD